MVIRQKHDLLPMHLHNLLGYAKTETGALPRGMGFIHLIEAIEDMQPVFFGDDRTIIGDIYRYSVIMQQRGAYCQAPILPDKFQCIVDNVYNHLRYSVLVCMYHAGFQHIIDLYVQVLLLDICHAGNQYIADQLADIKIRPLKLLHTVIHTAELQQIVNQPLEAVGFIKNNLQVLMAPIMLSI